MKEIIKIKGSVYGDTNCWNQLNAEILKLEPSAIFVLTDSNTSLHCFPRFEKELQHTISPIQITIPAGEMHKNITSCTHVWEQLSEQGADRNSLLINVGGGVVTDLGGFVAATFMRGIHCINIPTSLLAMVDAAVGGKNGVDLGVLKNQIGIIKNPHCVIVDPHFIKTLPVEEIHSGFAEMLKHGIIHDKMYWERLKHFSLDNYALVSDLIWESIEIKNTVVTQDPTEQGLRKTLNYGHTLGHAIESYCLASSERTTLLHGEAIAIGMILASYISFKETGLTEADLNEISTVISKKYSKITFKDNEIEKIIELLKYDKKNKGGVVNFVLLTQFGACQINKQVSHQLLIDSFNYYAGLKF